MDKDIFRDKLWKQINSKLYLKTYRNLSNSRTTSVMFVQDLILLKSPRVPISISYPPFLSHFPFICQALLSSEKTTYVTKQKGRSRILPMRIGRIK